MATIKNIILHPIVNGAQDTNTNLYPQTILTNITDLTEAQLAAINSGATSSNIAQIATNTTAIATEKTRAEGVEAGLESSKQDKLTAGSGVEIDSTSNEISAELTYEEELDAPVVTSSTAGTLTFEENANASGYEIYSGETKVGEVS